MNADNEFLFEGARRAVGTVLDLAQQVPLLAPFALAMKKLLNVCYEHKCNKQAFIALKQRLVYFTEVMLKDKDGLSRVAQERGENKLLTVCLQSMCHILDVGFKQLEKFTKRGFLGTLLTGSKAQEIFAAIDRDLSKSLNDFSVALQVVVTNEQKDTYYVVCNIKDLIEEKLGGLNGVYNNPDLMHQLADVTGAKYEDLKNEVQDQMSIIENQVNEVNEGVKLSHEMLVRIQESIDLIRNGENKSKHQHSFTLIEEPIIYDHEIIGRGTFGHIVKGKYLNEWVAIKLLNYLDEESMKILDREIQIHAQLSQIPGVVKLKAARCQFGHRGIKNCIVMELADCSLHHALYDKKSLSSLSVTTKLSILYQLAIALKHMSSIGIIHRDVKPLNVLLFSLSNNTVTAKLCDFGLSKKCNTNSTVSGDIKGTIVYMAPELAQQKYSQASDVYAYCMLANETIQEEKPFNDIIDTAVIFANISKGHRPSYHPIKGFHYFDEFYTMIQAGWRPNPFDRWSFDNISSFVHDILTKENEIMRYGTVSIQAKQNNFSSSAQSNDNVSNSNSNGSNNNSNRNVTLVLEELDTDQLCNLLLNSKISSKVVKIFEENEYSGLTLYIQQSKEELMHDLKVTLVEAKMLWALTQGWKQNGVNEAKTQAVVTSNNRGANSPIRQADIIDSRNEQSTDNSVKSTMPQPPPSIPILSSKATPNKTEQPLLLSDNDNKKAQEMTLRRFDLFSDDKLFTITWNVMFPCNITAMKNDILLLISYYDKHQQECRKDYFYQACLALIHYKGVGSTVKVDKAKALSLASASCLDWLAKQTKNAYAILIIARFYVYGLNLPENKAEVYRLYQLALSIDSNSMYAQDRLGHSYSEGYGVAKDPAKAVQYFKLAANQGYAQGQLNLGRCYKEGEGVAKDLLIAEKYFKMAAAGGSADALNYLGHCYYNGDYGFAKNLPEALKYFKLAANEDSPQAQFNIGAMYEHGQGVEQNYTEAAKYYKLSADNGFKDGQFYYGYYCHLGRGIKKNMIEAIKYYKLAASQDFANAQLQLGKCYYDGEGETKNITEAVKYYKLAADQGNVNAQAHLASLYYNGEGITKNLDEAVRYYKLAADQGDEVCQYNCGLAYEQGYSRYGVNLEEAFRYYKLSADQGFTDSENNLANCYRNGVGVTKDLTLALKYYKIAADKGHIIAQFNLGCCYKEGEGVAKNVQEAVKYFKLAADGGIANAQSQLAFCYYNGDGITKNLPEALKYFKLAANQGNEYCQFNIGAMYEHGQVVEQSYTEAAKHYKLAADKGYVNAQFHYAYYCHIGRGINKNMIEAIKYYKLAAKQGYGNALYQLGQCYENGEGVRKDMNEAIRYYELAAEKDIGMAQKKLTTLKK